MSRGVQRLHDQRQPRPRRDGGDGRGGLRLDGGKLFREAYRVSSEQTRHQNAARRRIGEDRLDGASEHLRVLIPRPCHVHRVVDAGRAAQQRAQNGPCRLGQAGHLYTLLTQQIGGERSVTSAVGEDHDPRAGTHGRLTRQRFADSEQLVRTLDEVHARCLESRAKYER